MCLVANREDFQRKLPVFDVDVPVDCDRNRVDFACALRENGVSCVIRRIEYLTSRTFVIAYVHFSVTALRDSL